MSYGFVSIEGTREWSFTTLPQTIINPQGDWRPYCPTYEAQDDIYPTCGCTVWCVQNAIEFMVKHLTSVEPNYSEYFTIILARIFPPGRPSKYADEAIKEHGLIPADMLPLPDREDAYLNHRPILSRYMLDEGLAWLNKYEFGREELWAGKIPLERQIAWLKYGLKRSPLAIGTKGHRTLVTFFDEATRHVTIFDTYDHTQAIRSIEGAEIVECVRFYLAPRVPTSHWFTDLMKRLCGRIT
jgi:hypothetical protein